MQHLALYRKYRPQTFSQVISQPHITVTLQNQIKKSDDGVQRIAHAYLFMGSRGTGKTSCAKILAKAINCTNSANGDPCLTCEACKIANTSTDVHEIDAASNSRVEEMRSLLEESSYLPAELKYKVYIIDEVHMLSISAFNALLKTLEEPPPHVVFILATTEIHKVPATILSRCQRYEFNRINADDSAKALIAIAEKEGFTLEQDAAGLISRLSDGGMRDALSLLDVAASEAAIKGSSITQEVVRNCAGIAGKEHVFAITDAIAKKDGKSALTIISGLYAKSKDPSRLIDELLQHFRNLMLAKLMPDDFSLLTALPEEYDDYKNQANLFTLESILDGLDKLERCLQIKGRKVESEICIMRMCVDERTSGGAGKSENTTVSFPTMTVATPTPTPVVTPSVVATAPNVEPTPTPLAVTELTPVTQSPEETPKPQPEQPKITGRNTSQLAKWADWNVVLEKLDPYRASMLEETSAGLSGRTLVITGGEVLQHFFDNQDNIAVIERTVRETTNQDYKVVFDNIESGGFNNEFSKVEETITVVSTSPAPPPAKAQSPAVRKIELFLAEVKTAGIEIN
ncbi:MAG: DNA polymerase III subunit gamma/tau [Oscillospiraceae bacterium]|nr:DNA polymerase III subunit gamma/tau [Oscillospiraceae bacterium]